MASRLHPVIQELNGYPLQPLEADIPLTELQKRELKSPRVNGRSGFLPEGFILRSVYGSPPLQVHEKGDLVFAYTVQGLNIGPITELLINIDGREYLAWVSSALVDLQLT